MALERHRARRYPLRAIAELTEVESDIRIRDWTGNLSLFGCQVNTPKLMPAGTKVWIKILFRSENFKALGKVVYALRNTGMGILFTEIDANDQSVLDKWIADQRHPREQG